MHVFVKLCTAYWLKGCVNIGVLQTNALSCKFEMLLLTLLLHVEWISTHERACTVHVFEIKQQY